MNGVIPGLDGIRAIAIAAVVFGHFGSLLGLAPVIATQAWRGVIVFFGLSGFLITTLLLREEASCGAINLRYFYIRRALRILPLAYLCLGTISVLKLLGKANVGWSTIASAAFFCRNLFPQDSITGHFWSLSIEEQFYLAWPLCLVLMRNNRIRIALTSTLFFLAPFWRQFLYVQAGGGKFVNQWRIDVCGDALLVGCLLSLLVAERTTWLPQKQLWAFLAAGVFVFLGLPSVPSVPVLRAFYPTFSLLALGVFLSVVVLSPTCGLTRLLEVEPVAWLGRLSYSVYVWQQLFLPRYGLSGLPASGHLRVLLILVVSCSSYYMIERPILRYRKIFRADLANRDRKS